MIMKNYTSIAFFPLLIAFVAGCVKIDGVDGADALSASSGSPSQHKLNFDITVTREDLSTRETTKGLVDASDLLATMDTRRPFSLIAIEKDSGDLLLNNRPVFSRDGEYTYYMDGGLLEIPTPVLFSAYYPHVMDVTYEDAGHKAYSIPFQSTEVEAGPLVSKTVETSIRQLNTLPLTFGHITNDIGFRVCDVTAERQMQGHIRLRKLIAHQVASAGVYLNDIVLGRGNWNYQGYYREVTVFEGDAPVGIGSSNERFVGSDALVEKMSDSRRFYAIPDQIVMGKQYIEAVFDVDSFTLNGETYGPLEGQVLKYPIYGILPGNTMVPGKQYTFHLGMDLGSIYREISFTAGVSDWETKIYENNDDF